MWEFFNKILIVFLERKDSFKKIDEKLTRRIQYFNDIKEVHALDIEEYEKIARKNVIAQRLIGSQLISFDIVNFLVKHKNIKNFEIVAKTLAFWESCLLISKDDEGKIIRISLNKLDYFKEKIMISITYGLSFFILIVYLFRHSSSSQWLINNLMFGEGIAVFIQVTIFLVLVALNLFLFFTMIILFDLKRIVKLLND